VPVQVPAFFTGRDVRRIPDGSVALLAPFPSPRNASPMFWQAMADLRFRTPGGYFVGPDPSGKPHYGANPRRLSGVMAKVRSGWQASRLGPALRAELAGDLACWRVSTVVGGVWVWWDVRPGELQGGRAAPDRGPGQPSPRR
jgi:hypothetical protein